MGLKAQEFGERLAELRAQAEAREDPLLVDLLDLMKAVFLEPAKRAEKPSTPGKQRKP